MIGKQLSGLETLQTVCFAPIAGGLSNIKRLDPSRPTDKRYLRDMRDAISIGVFSEPLSRRNLGTLSHSRWLTAANRLLRLCLIRKTIGELSTNCRF